MGTWYDPELGRPIAAPLEQCAELLGLDLPTIRELATSVEPYIRVDGTKVWSLMQLERQLRPDAYGRVRGGYIARRRPPDHPNPEPVTDEARHCSFCGSASGPFTRVEGLFTVLMCTDCQAARGHGPGPYLAMTRAEMHESLALLPSWVLAQKAAANRHLIAVTRERLAAGEDVPRMYQEPGLAWLERQAQAAEDLLAERRAADPPE